MVLSLRPVYTRAGILNNHAVLLEGLGRKREEMKIWVMVTRFRMDGNENKKH